MSHEQADSGYKLDASLELELSALDFGIRIGYYKKAGELRECRLLADDRLRHCWHLGKTGTGKSNLLSNEILQDIEHGNGITIIDPHGELADYALASVPENRLNDVVLVDFSYTSHLPIINPLDIDSNDERKKTIAIQIIDSLIKSRVKDEFHGPRGEEMMRLRLETIMDPGYPFERSITEIEPLTLNDAHLDAVLRGIQSDRLKSQWSLEKRSRRDSDWNTTIHWFLSKVHEWVSDPTLRFFMGGGKSTIDIKNIIESGKILIVKIPEASLGSSVADFVGSYFVAIIKNAIMERSHESGVPLLKHHVFIDEFQRFATADFAVLLAEARKFGCGFTLANQNIRQLVRFNRYNSTQDSSLLEAVLGNVGTTVCFSIGTNDARIIAEQFDVALDSIRHIGRYKAMVKLLFDNREMEPVIISVPLAPKPKGEPASSFIRKRMMDTGIWQPICKKDKPSTAGTGQKKQETIETLRALLDMRINDLAVDGSASDNSARTDTKKSNSKTVAKGTAHQSWEDISFLTAKGQEAEAKEQSLTDIKSDDSKSIGNNGNNHEEKE